LSKRRFRLCMTKSKRKKKSGERARGSSQGNQGKSSLTAQGTDTRLWNVNAQPWPGFHNTLKKDNSVHRFIQMVDFGVVLTASTIAIAGYGVSFKLTNLPQQTTFTALFDQYRIDEIELWFEPQVIDVVLTTAPAKIYSAIDYDDAGTPSSINAMMQYTNCNIGSASQGHYVRFRPHVAIAAYGSGAFSSYSNRSAMWIDAGSPSVEHYGFKAVIPIGTVGYSVTLNARFHVSCRNVF
jgi:hypothetical protein